MYLSKKIEQYKAARRSGSLWQVSKLAAFRLIWSGVSPIRPTKEGHGKVYFITHNAGLFSCLSVALEGVIQLRPESVSGRFGMGLYKNSPFSDPWKTLFETAVSAPPPELCDQNEELWQISSWWSKRYDALPISDMKCFVETYFSPGEKVRSSLSATKLEFGLNPEGLVGVHYRGTDKVKEIEPPDYEEFSKAVDSLISNHPNLKILLQTDEPSFQKYMRDRYGDALIVVEEKIAQKKNRGLHFAPALKPLQGAIFYFSMVLLLSECRFLVTHTGNGALWEVLFRGSSNGVTQL